MATVAFIGLGNMGGPMAWNILKAGHKLQAFDLSKDALAAAEKAGGQAFTDVKVAVTNADAVVSMLPKGDHVRDVYLNNVLAVAKPGAVLMDCSTVDVMTARDVIAAAAKKNLLMVDAPVSGGVAAADAGTLTFMVGGTDAAFAAAKPYLEKMGKAIIHAGGPGSGQAAKICNNMLLGISMIGVSEAFKLGEKLGLDARTLFDISSKASGQCWSMTSYCPVPGIVPTAPSNRDYAPGFTAAMMLKDLKLSQEAAASVSATTTLGETATKLYERFVEGGQGGLDFSAIIKTL